MSYKSARKLFIEGRCPQCGEAPPCFRFNLQSGTWMCAGCACQWYGIDAWFWTIAKQYGWIIGGQNGRAIYQSMKTGEVIVLDTYKGVHNSEPYDKNTLGEHSEKWYAPIGPFYKVVYDTETELLAAYRCKIMIRHTEAAWATIKDKERAEYVAAHPDLCVAVERVCKEIYPKVLTALEKDYNGR